MIKNFILCLLILFVFGCKQNLKEENKQLVIEGVNELNEELSSKNCHCQSDREISTPQFIDDKNGIIICFDDIRSYYDEFESYFFTIYDCIGDSVIFDKNYGPDNCLMKVNDSTIIFDLVIQTPIQYQLFVEKSKNPQFTDTRFVKYTLDKRSKSINMSLLDSKMNDDYYNSFLQDYNRNKLNLNYLRDWVFQEKLLLSCWFKPKETEVIYKSIRKQIEEIQTFDGEPFWDNSHYYRFIYTEKL